MIILGVDPGTRFTGFCIIQNKQILQAGLMKLKPSEPMHKRIEIFYDILKEKIESFNVDTLSIETPFFYKNAATYMKLGYLRGILYLLTSKFSLTLKEYTPCQVKQRIAGHGGAKKEQVAYMVYKLFPNLKKGLNDNVTDAIAIAFSATK